MTDVGGHTEVLIVGAGPVGLTLAIELGFRGVSCVIVEKRAGEVTVPKMSGVTARGMEICRKWGIANKVRGAGIPKDHSGDIIYMENLLGPELARWGIPAANEIAQRSYTPEPPCKCAQIFFDPILADLARSLPSVTLRYNTEVETFDDDGNGVSASIASAQTGTKETVKAAYLVGCDGPKGLVREALGIEREGLGVVAQSVNIFFRSPVLATLHNKGWAHVYRPVDESGCWSELIPIDGKELWRLTLFNDREGVEAPHDRLYRLVGGAFPFEILSVLPWERRDYVTRSYGRGRCYIAGDAAHECSPTGGLGMHTGIEEALNLGWKLAGSLQGWGGNTLLSSYVAERRPIALRNVNLATRSFHAIEAIPGFNRTNDADVELWQRDLRANLADHLVGEFLKMQYCYENSPICEPDGTPPVEENRLYYTPSARPGTRAPHLWLEDGRSSLDLFDWGFTLLRIGANAPDGASLMRAARSKGIPISLVLISEPAARELYECALCLVRPDGHVCWRGEHAPENPDILIDRVRGAF